MKFRVAYLSGSHIASWAMSTSDSDAAIFADNYEAIDFFTFAKLLLRAFQDVHNNVELHYFPAGDVVSSDLASFAAVVLETGKKVV